MPFRRMYYAAKRTRSVLSKKARKEVGRIIDRRAETHHDDTVSGVNNMTWSWAATSLADPAQGSADTQRVGDMVQQHRLHFKAAIKIGSTDNVVRVIVFRWLDESVVSLADIVDQTGGLTSPLATYTHDTRCKYRVLYDSGPMGLSLAGRGVITINKNINLKGYKQRFEAGSTDSIKGDIYVMYCSDKDAAGSNFPTLQYVSRKQFKDF